MTTNTTLITGSSGLVGYPLSKLLTARGDRVVGLDPAPPPEAVPGVTCIESGFGDYESTRALLDRHGITKIVHAGGISGPMLSRDAPHHITKTNLVSTLDLAEAAYRHGIARFVYCSSVSAYEIMDEGPVREDAPLRPESVYGATKAASDHVLMAYRAEYGLDAVGLRYSTVYGPRRATDCVIRTMIEDAITGRPTRLPSGAGRRWPFVYVDDVVTATIAIDGTNRRMRVVRVPYCRHRNPRQPGRPNPRASGSQRLGARPQLGARLDNRSRNQSQYRLVPPLTLTSSACVSH
jgi:nucleoside-diphosphate-sugar epimerase